MVFFIGLLTLIMILDCVVLVFLVLIQLPKKDAGAGLAFGAGATDALFGAGSGTVLTKITKYAAGTFFVLSVILSLLQSRFHSRAGNIFKGKITSAPPPAATAPATPAARQDTPPPTATSLGAVPNPPSTNTASIIAEPTNPAVSFSNSVPTNLLVAPTNAEAPK